MIKCKLCGYKMKNKTLKYVCMKDRKTNKPKSAPIKQNKMKSITESIKYFAISYAFMFNVQKAKIILLIFVLSFVFNFSISNLFPHTNYTLH